jgi:glycosyltransferase involved in cell wall biosynthesis
VSTGVSVVIPVFNGALYLGAAIESVLAQTRAADAIIVVDDGSTDESAAVASQFGAKVQYLRRLHEGAAAARNAGQAAVQSPLLAFLDADDLWLPQKLERQLPLIANAKEPNIIFGHTERFVSPDLSEEERMLLRWDPGPVAGPCCSSMLMQNSAFASLGGFNPSLQVGEFLEWFARARKAEFQCVTIPEVVFRRRLHKNNMGRSHNNSRANFARTMKAVLDIKRAST